jgi:hypothetical protein
MKNINPELAKNINPELALQVLLASYEEANEYLR